MIKKIEKENLSEKEFQMQVITMGFENIRFSNMASHINLVEVKRSSKIAWISLSISVFAGLISLAGIILYIQNIPKGT